ncbi:MAG: SGNH/GDSL hydrolase family protein [Lentisphaeria bacterium]|nr:SGNH/GDSL hydrolase family protein [Lentisphaeria bacterium]
MKKIIMPLLAAASLVSIADETLYTDNFKQMTWRVINTKNFATAENKVLLLTDSKPYFRALAGEQPFGAKFKFSIERVDEGSYKLGFVVYPIGGKIIKVQSPELTGKGEFTIELPARSKALGMTIQGPGKYKNPQLVRIIDPSYRLEADPQYQLVSGKAKPVGFVLYHNEKEVPDARIRENGLEAAHPESGATAQAYVDQGDPAPFDAIAKQIKIEKPVSILYLGDSLTHYDIGHNHVDKVGYFLNKFNPDKVKVWNYACGGDDIERVVQRLHGTARGRWKNRYHDLWARQYDWAIVFLGHNDTKASSANNFKEALVPPAKQKAAYQELIGELKKKGITRIILFSSSSSNFELCKQNSAKLQRIHNRFGDPVHQEAFNQVLQDLAKENGLEYMDLYTDMKALPDKASLLKSSDGVHLSAKGHDYVALKTLEYLNKTQK